MKLKYIVLLFFIFGCGSKDITKNVIEDKKNVEKAELVKKVDQQSASQVLLDSLNKEGYLLTKDVSLFELDNIQNLKDRIEFPFVALKYVHDAIDILVFYNEKNYEKRKLIKTKEKFYKLFEQEIDRNNDLKNVQITIIKRNYIDIYNFFFNSIDDDKYSLGMLERLFPLQKDKQIKEIYSFDDIEIYKIKDIESDIDYTKLYKTEKDIYEYEFTNEHILKFFSSDNQKVLEREIVRNNIIDISSFLLKE